MKKSVKIILWSLAGLILAFTPFRDLLLFTKVRYGLPSMKRNTGYQLSGRTKSSMLFSKSPAFNMKSRSRQARKSSPKWPQKTTGSITVPKTAASSMPNQLAKFDVVIFNNSTANY